MTIPAARRQEIIEAVAAGLARGTPLTVICETIKADDESLYRWLRDAPEAKLAISYARDLGFDWLANECLTIADDTSQDVLWDKDGIPHPNGAGVLSRRVRIETRLKLLSKWDPKRYGELRQVKVEGEVEVQHHYIDPRSLDDAGRAALRHLIEHLPSEAPVDAEFEELPSED